MNKKSIIIIACIIALVLIISFAIFFITKSNKSNNTVSERKIVIIQYDENFNVAKKIDVTNKKDIKDLEKICNNLSLEQDETSKYLGIRNDIKLELNSNEYFMIQEGLTDYCYYENSDTDTQLVIKMPNGLSEKVNEIISNNG